MSKARALKPLHFEFARTETFKQPVAGPPEQQADFSSMPTFEKCVELKKLGLPQYTEPGWFWVYYRNESPYAYLGGEYMKCVYVKKPSVIEQLGLPVEIYRVPDLQELKNFILNTNNPFLYEEYLNRKKEAINQNRELTGEELADLIIQFKQNGGKQHAKN